MPNCAYCGCDGKSEREHVIPKCLYPESRGKSNSKIQRLTVPSCSSCNRAWSADEAHFRNILAIAGEGNEAVRELWTTTVRRGFHDDVDGQGQCCIKQMVPVEIDGQPRHKVFPAHDGRVMRVVRKIIRGLCFHHGLDGPVPDTAVFADVLKFTMPPDVLENMPLLHREADIFQYRFAPVLNDELHSGWLLTFYERMSFIGGVWPA
jgi:hypothetical protein